MDLGKKIFILGAGGHARSVVDSLLLQGILVSGFLDPDPKLKGEIIYNIPVLGDEDILAGWEPKKVNLVNGLGTVDVSSKRKDIFLKYKERGYEFLSVIHPRAIVSPFAKFSEGVQIMAGAVIQPGTKIGENTLINSGSILDHDCEISSHVHIATGVRLSGGVKVGELCHIGTGATVIQCKTIGRETLVAAGAVVTKDIAPKVRVAGIPARVI